MPIYPVLYVSVMSPICKVMGVLIALQNIKQGQVEKFGKLEFPVAHVDPLLELSAHALEMRNLLESKAFMQRDAGMIRLGNAAQDHQYFPAAQGVDQNGMQLFAYPTSRKVCNGFMSLTG